MDALGVLLTLISKRGLVCRRRLFSLDSRLKVYGPNRKVSGNENRQRHADINVFQNVVFFNLVRSDISNSWWKGHCLKTHLLLCTAKLPAAGNVSSSTLPLD